LLSSACTKSIQEGLSELEAIEKSNCFPLVSAKAHRKLTSVLSLVKNLGDAITPDKTIANGGPFYAEVLHRLQFFFTVKVAGDDGSEVGLCGKAALLTHWEEIEKKRR